MIGIHEIDKFESMIASLDRKKEDFELLVSKKPILPGIYPRKGIVIIKHTITGARRTYLCGDDSHWVADFENDLKKGLFEDNVLAFEKKKT